jgi:UDP-glucose 4-epimerase
VKVLVTGGAGFIGSHLSEKLVKNEISVIAIDDLSSGNTSNIEHLIQIANFHLIEGSILNFDLIKNAMRNVDGCIHLGAALGVRRILESPYESFITNTKGTENVILAAAKYKKRLFVASTSEIYGKNLNQPLTEDSDRVLGSPQLLRWVYSETKAIDESLAQMFFQSDGLDYVVGRFFNTVGPRQSGMYGMVLPRFIEAAVANKPLQVHGDGSQTRVFCHVEDSVEAVYRLFMNKSASGKAFNIGGVGEISILDLAKKVIEVTNSRSKIEFIPYEIAYPQGFDEMMRRVPDTRRLRELTGWSPTKGLEDIIRDIQSHRLTN